MEVSLWPHLGEMPLTAPQQDVPSGLSVAPGISAQLPELSEKSSSVCRESGTRWWESQKTPVSKVLGWGAVVSIAVRGRRER